MIYVSSRATVKRIAMWQDFRAQGIQISSSWIDEKDNTQINFMNLWINILDEIRNSSRLVLYAEAEDFPLKGALVEIGIALGMLKPVTVCFPNMQLEPPTFRPVGSWIKHPLVVRYDDNLVSIMDFYKREQ